MKLLKQIFIGILIVVFTTTGAFAVNNCDNPEYIRTHPSECKKNKNNILLWSGAAALLGATSLLATQSSGGGESAPAPQSSQQSRNLTLSANTTTTYGLSDLITNQRISSLSYLGSLGNGTDIDASIINNIKSSQTYAQNNRQLDNINFAWAYARGYTGKNVTINILDDFYSSHGNTVRDIVTYIAPDATINSYNIATPNSSVFLYDNITNTLNTAQPGKIYNASWQVPSTSSQNAATAIYNNNSIKTYAQAQDYFYNNTNQNFINTIRNTATNNDAIFVFAAGNESQTESGMLSAMPIAFPDLTGHFVNVVAVDNNNNIAWYSNQCGITQNYCISAPGSAWNTETTDYASGTSFAAPAVSAAIATIQEAFPYMTANQITELLFTTATDLGETGIDAVYGWGLLNMEKATKPVGTPKIILANDTIQPLNTTNISGTAAGAIKNANIQMAFVDDFGRAFTTNLSDNINIIPYGRGFDRLRESDTDSVVLPGGIEFGSKQNNLLKSSGLVSTKSNDLINFIGFQNEFSISDLRFYQQIRTGISNPTPEENSIVSGFSTIYTQTIKTGVKWKDLSFEFAIPDQIIAGDMSLYIPVARTNNGKILYNDANIDLSTKPSTEYTIKYNNFSATYINNPDWQDEFFIMAKIKGTF